jgi:hypothetical protein
MAHRQQSNSSEHRKQHARPEDPKTNTRPPGNGEREQPDARRAEQKLYEVSGH